MFSDAQLDGFLDDALPAEEMVAIEAALRTNDALAQRLTAAVGRRDAGVHSLAAIWRRHRLTCPSREQLGSHLLGVLEPQFDAYLKFHLTTIGCRKCQASLEDLRAQSAAAAAEQGAAERRRTRYFQSSAGYLSGKSD